MKNKEEDICDIFNYFKIRNNAGDGESHRRFLYRSVQVSWKGKLWSRIQGLSSQRKQDHCCQVHGKENALEDP